MLRSLLEVTIILIILSLLITYVVVEASKSIYREDFRGAMSKYSDKDITPNKKVCNDNLNKILEAVEKYNLNNSVKIKELNDKEIKKLKDNNYLESIPKVPRQDCSYLSDGDLTDKGTIYCKYHGDVSNKLKIWTALKVEDDTEKKTPTNWNLFGFKIFISIFSVSFILACFFVFSMPLLMKITPKKKRKKTYF